MIVEAVLNLLIGMIKTVFGWINLPQLPDEVMSIIDQLFDILSGAMGLLSIFMDIDMLKILLPVLLIVINFDEAYKLTMFILRKIPFLGIK